MIFKLLEIKHNNYLIIYKSKFNSSNALFIYSFYDRRNHFNIYQIFTKVPNLIVQYSPARCDSPPLGKFRSLVAYLQHVK